MAGFRFDEAGLGRRVVRELVTRGAVASLSAKFLPGIDRRVWSLSGGRATFSSWLTGLPVVELTTVGARSRMLRRTRVLGVPAGDDLIVVAANFGSVSNPGWYHNARVNPRVTVRIHGRLIEFDARELAGAERDAAFRRALELNPGWTRFQQHAADRMIPVMLLTPVRIAG